MEIRNTLTQIKERINKILKHVYITIKNKINKSEKCVYCSSKNSSHEVMSLSQMYRKLAKEEWEYQTNIPAYVNKTVIDTNNNSERCIYCSSRNSSHEVMSLSQMYRSSDKEEWEYTGLSQR